MMYRVSVKMPEIYVKGIDELVKAGRYSSRSEFIRIAVRELLKRELWGDAPPAQDVGDVRVELSSPFALPQQRQGVLQG